MPDEDRLPDQLPPPPPPPPPLDVPAGRRREQRLNRDRQEQRRERMRLGGIPETHRVQSALAEALSFVVASRQLTRTLTPEMAVIIYEIKTAAERVLVERKGCEPAASARAVRRQMRVRPEHRVDPVLRLPARNGNEERDDI